MPGRCVYLCARRVDCRRLLTRKRIFERTFRPQLELRPASEAFATRVVSTGMSLWVVGGRSHHEDMVLVPVHAAPQPPEKRSKHVAHRQGRVSDLPSGQWQQQGICRRRGMQALLATRRGLQITGGRPREVVGWIPAVARPFESQQHNA